MTSMQIQTSIVYDTFMQELYKITGKEEYLTQLRRVIPFLQEIPDPIYFRLDNSEFYLPDNGIAKERSMLEEQIGHHIMIYKRDVFNLAIPVDRHLCANIKGAELLPEQLELLQTFEIRNTEIGVSFVAYQNPLVLIDPQTSALQQFYRERISIKIIYHRLFAVFRILFNKRSRYFSDTFVIATSMTVTSSLKNSTSTPGTTVFSFLGWRRFKSHISIH